MSHEQNEFIRRMAVQRVRDGERPSDVIASYGLCRTSIYRWLRQAADGSSPALAARKHPGRSPKLNQSQQSQVVRWIVGKEPRQQALDFGLWTRDLVRHLIKERMGIDLSRSAVGLLLRKLGITSQKPLRRAYERDPIAIRRWKTETFPAIKQRAKRRGAEIFFLDEAGIRSDSPLQRTWGRKGETPIVQTSGRRQSINAISAISLRGDFWFEVYTGSLNAERFAEFLLRFGQRRNKPVILIVDGHPSHRSRAVVELVRRLKGRLELAFLPPYAPDLNPDEFVWNHLRNEGTTKRPLKINESLKERVRSDLIAIGRDRRLCLSFFKAKSVAYTCA